MRQNRLFSQQAVTPAAANSTLTNGHKQNGSVDQAVVVNGVVESDYDDLNFQRLEEASAQGNEKAFLELKEEIDWTHRPASDFTKAVRWALAVGSAISATNLSAQGAALYPQHEELQKMAYLLAPPKVIKRELPPTSSVRADHEWMKKHQHEYPKQWVALRNGELLGTAPTLQKLVEQVGTTTCVFFAKIY